jgi:hypothetical protein
MTRNDNTTKGTKMIKATKVRDSEWKYRGGFIEHLGKKTGMRSASWRWACCGAGGFCGTKDDAKKAIDGMLREAQAILESEAMLCPGPNICLAGIGE